METAISFAAMALLIVGAASATTAVYKPPYAPVRSDISYRRRWRVGISLMVLAVAVWVAGRLIGG